VRVAEQGQEVVVAVADDGPGVPAEDLSHLFERFWRGDRGRRRATGGSGLCLTIARHIVEGTQRPHLGRTHPWQRPHGCLHPPRHPRRVMDNPLSNATQCVQNGDWTAVGANGGGLHREHSPRSCNPHRVFVGLT
jgi:hypothetical protein